MALSRLLMLWLAVVWCRAAYAGPRIQDPVLLFAPAQTKAMESRLERLSKNTQFEVFLEVRNFDGFGTFTESASESFEVLIERTGHPRVALVLIGIDRTAGRGMVGTNLGAGLNHILTREQAADLFLAAGERFSAERIGEGVDRLASKLEEWHTTQNASRDQLFPEDAPRSWHQRYGVRFYPALLLLMAAGFLGWRTWRAKICPTCGAVMRTRVRLGGPGGAAVRTRKCFECGFVQKRRLEGWRLGKGRSRGTPRQ